MGYLLEAFGVPLGGLWASWGSPWRSLGSPGHHFGGPGALLGTTLELSGACWAPCLWRGHVFEWILRAFLNIYVVIVVMFVVCLGCGMIDRAE